MSRKIKTKSKEAVKDAQATVDGYIANDTEAAAMLKEIVGDDFPDLDLQQTPLDEAVANFGAEIEELQDQRKSKRKLAEIGDLNEQLKKRSNKTGNSKKKKKKKKKKKRKK